MATEMLPEKMSQLWLKGASDAAAEEDSASRGCKICITNTKDPASRAAASRAVESRAFCENCSLLMSDTSKIKAAGWKSLKAAGKENKAKPAEVKAAGGKLVPCKICVAKGKDAGCQFCIAKAAALDLIDAAGGDIVEAAAAAEEKCKAKPFCVVDLSCLKKMEEDGGRIIKEASKEGVVGKVVTVRLPDSNVKSLMSGRLPRPFSPLPDSYFQEYPNLREPMCVSAAAVLYSLSRKESVLAQFFEKGYAVVDFELA